jgi:flagellar biosynthesis activator protein FlaF
VTALDQARAAYGVSAHAIRTPRDTEHDALSRVTGALRRAQDGGAASFPDFARAVHDNRALWTVFATDLAGEGNGLPKPLRGRLLSLAIFVEAHSSKVLRGTATVDPLVDINLAVMRGLRAAEPAA